MATNPPAVGNILRVTQRCFLDPFSQLGESVYHFRVTAIVGGGVSLQQLAYRFAEKYAPVIRPWMGTSGFYEGCTVKAISPGVQTPAFKNTVFAGGGTGGGASIPPQNCGLLTFTGVANDGGFAINGRAYIPFPDNKWVSIPTGRPTAAMLDQLRSIGLANLATINLTSPTNPAITTSVQWVIWSRAAATFAPVAQYSPGGGFATQKRRSYYNQRNRPIN